MTKIERTEIVLGDHCTRITVGHVGPMADRYVSEGIPFLRSQDIAPFSISRKDTKFIDDGFDGELGNSRLRAGDVVVVRTGYPGTAAVVPKELDGANCADLVIIRPGPDLDPWFLAAIFNSTWGRGQVGGVLVGAAQQHFNVGAAKRMRVQVPTLSEQQAAGRIIRSYSELIEVNRRRMAVLEDVARSVFAKFFEIVDERGAKADGWEPAVLNDWASEVRDSVSPDKVEPSFRYIGLEHLPRRSTTLVDYGEAASVTSGKLRFTRGDVLFGKIRPYFHKVAFAPCAGLTSTDTIVIRAKEPHWISAVLGLVSSDPFVAHAVATSNGTKMPRADWKVLRNFPLPRPSPARLENFNASADPNLVLCANLADQNTRLTAARDLLVPKLISGEIDLSVASGLTRQAA